MWRNNVNYQPCLSQCRLGTKSVPNPVATVLRAISTLVLAALGIPRPAKSILAVERLRAVLCGVGYRNHFMPRETHDYITGLNSRPRGRGILADIEMLCALQSSYLNTRIVPFSPRMYNNDN
jgi:hypothetical protein